MIKRTILAACAMAFAFAALPALAAAEPITNNPGDPFFEGVKEGTKLTWAGGEVKVTASIGTIKCGKSSGSGEFFDSATGSLTLTFEECTGPSGVTCTTAEQSAGVVKTTALPFHLKTIEHEGVKKPGMLITPGPGTIEHLTGAKGTHFATFECPILGRVVVGGNGLIGTITTPEENKASETATISFSSTESGKTTQTHRKVAKDATEYDLAVSTGGGETGTAALDAEGVITFAEGMKPTLKTTEEEEGGGEVTNNPGDPFLNGVKSGTKFTTAGGELKKTGSVGTVKCKKNSGSGEFFDPETGSLSLVLEECTGPFNVKCTTAGQKEGVITTTTLPFHLKTVVHEGKETPGVLLTPGPGTIKHKSGGEGTHFFSYSCPFVGEVVWGGNGLIGTITKPEEGVASNTMTLSFSSTESGSTTQTHRKVKGSETEYDLKGSFGGSETKTAALDAETVITFAEGLKPTLETTPLG